jgi:uncharacterized protein YndB with AHSA1/START domain
MSMIAIIILSLIVGVAALLAYAATRPDTFVVQRSVIIKAPPARIFPFIENFHQWSQWSPYENKDPAMKRTFSGAAHGKGAVYAWDGNKNVGTGRMEITDTSTPSKITIKLDFIKPFEGHNTAEFSLAPVSDATKLTWTMRGPLPFMAKLMQIFMSMDHMIGKDFELGLENLRSISER